MRAMTAILPLEIEELPLQITGRPEVRAVQPFAANRSNQPLDERMRAWHVRDGLDLRHVEDPQIRLSLVKPIQRIVVSAEVRRRGLASRRSIEHSA